MGWVHPNHPFWREKNAENVWVKGDILCTTVTLMLLFFALVMPETESSFSSLKYEQQH